MRKFKLLLMSTLVFVLIGCEEYTTEENYVSNDIVEVTLEDGTRCVIYTTAFRKAGGISCDWESRSDRNGQ